MFHTKPIEIRVPFSDKRSFQRRRWRRGRRRTRKRAANNLSLIYWFSMIWLSSVDRNKCWYTIKRMRGLFVPAQSCCCCCCCFHYIIITTIEAVRFADALLLVVSLKLWAFGETVPRWSTLWCTCGSYACESGQVCGLHSCLRWFQLTTHTQ